MSKRSPEQVAVDMLRWLTRHSPVHVFPEIGATSEELMLLLVTSNVFTSCPACGAEPWVNIDCKLCGVCSDIGKEYRDQ